MGGGFFGTAERGFIEGQKLTIDIRGPGVGLDAMNGMIADLIRG